MRPGLSSVSVILTAISESLLPFMLRSLMLAEPMIAILSSTIISYAHTTTHDTHDARSRTHSTTRHTLS